MRKGGSACCWNHFHHNPHYQKALTWACFWFAWSDCTDSTESPMDNNLVCNTNLSPWKVLNLDFYHSSYLRYSLCFCSIILKFNCATISYFIRLKTRCLEAIDLGIFLSASILPLRVPWSLDCYYLEAISFIVKYYYFSWLTDFCRLERGHLLDFCCILRLACKLPFFSLGLYQP